MSSLLQDARCYNGLSIITTMPGSKDMVRGRSYSKRYVFPAESWWTLCESVKQCADFLNEAWFA